MGRQSALGSPTSTNLAGFRFICASRLQGLAAGRDCIPLLQPPARTLIRPGGGEGTGSFVLLTGADSPPTPTLAARPSLTLAWHFVHLGLVPISKQIDHKLILRRRGLGCGLVCVFGRGRWWVSCNPRQRARRQASLLIRPGPKLDGPFLASPTGQILALPGHSTFSAAQCTSKLTGKKT